jgi:hypothetical protein
MAKPKSRGIIIRAPGFESLLQMLAHDYSRRAAPRRGARDSNEHHTSLHDIARRAVPVGCVVGGVRDYAAE